jgi:hypothetical protein
MPGWTVLVLATPLFGLSLTPPTLDGAMFGTPDAVVGMTASLPMPSLLQTADAVPTDMAPEPRVDDAEAAPPETAPPVTETAPPEVQTPPPVAATHVQTAEEAAQAAEDARYTADVIRRREIGQIHRAMGIATWIAMTINLVIGMLQYNDLYGWGAGQENNPCTTGRGLILNECYGDPYAHIISATTTSVLYGGTFILSLSMPDPNDADQGNGEFAQHLRIHEILRWVHSFGMLSQIVIGALMSNGVFGDRANDYGTLEAIAAVHQTIGWVTWGALTGAAAVMLF